MVEILEQPDAAARPPAYAASSITSIPCRIGSARERSARKTALDLQRRDEERLEAVVIGRESRAELGDAGGDLGPREVDLPDGPSRSGL